MPLSDFFYVRSLCGSLGNILRIIAEFYDLHLPQNKQVNELNDCLGQNYPPLNMQELQQNIVISSQTKLYSTVHG